MTITNWFLGTCGKSHIGVYVCSRCGYELLRSGFEKSFVLKSPNLLQDLLPVAVAAAKGQATQQQREIQRNETNKNSGGNNRAIISRTPFNPSMLEDFTKNANLARIFHKNSLVRGILEGHEGSKATEGTHAKYEISCGKCGSSLGTQTRLSAGQAKFSIVKNRVDLTFRTT